MSFLDTFHDTPNLPLAQHTSDSGDSWANDTSDCSASGFQISNAGSDMYFADDTLGSASNYICGKSANSDVSLTAVIDVLSLRIQAVSIGIRDGYWLTFDYDPLADYNGWMLVKDAPRPTVPGTLLASGGMAWDPGTLPFAGITVGTWTLILSAIGSVISVTINGTLEVTVTDSSFVGPGTFRVYADRQKALETAGMHFESLQADAAIDGAPILTPLSATVAQGHTQAFGTNEPCNFTVVEGAGGGTLSNPSGTHTVYTAPSSAGTYHVKATSIANPCCSETAVITVPVVAPGIYFQARMAREADASDESCGAYGKVTGFLLTAPISAGHYILEMPVTDMDGVGPGDNVRIKVFRDGSHPLDTSDDPCTILKAALEYDEI